MDEIEYDHLVADRLQMRLPKTVWAQYPAACVDQQAKRVLAEHVGVEVELDVQTMVLRVVDDVVVYLE